MARPRRADIEQLKEEVAGYERLQRGEFDELQNVEGLGRLRIAQGLSQRELAERLEMAATGGTFGTYLSRLAGPELIERDRERGVRLNPEMMGD